MDWEPPIVLFDGVCHLCQGSVKFIIKRDPKRQLRFASLQSDFAKKRLGSICFKPESLSSIVFIEKGKAYRESTAALKIAAYLRAPWKFLKIFKIVPRFIRDPLYRWVAKNRYRWFGKDETCWLPSPELRELFLDEGGGVATDHSSSESVGAR
jgi:predicted DCC family thiol-disulfide oxidoreductase YuxK